jgi:hypothetical protein
VNPAGGACLEVVGVRCPRSLLAEVLDAPLRKRDHCVHMACCSPLHARTVNEVDQGGSWVLLPPASSAALRLPPVDIFAVSPPDAPAAATRWSGRFPMHTFRSFEIHTNKNSQNLSGGESRILALKTVLGGRGTSLVLWLCVFQTRFFSDAPDDDWPLAR